MVTEKELFVLFPFVKIVYVIVWQQNITISRLVVKSKMRLFNDLYGYSTIRDEFLDGN